MALSIGNNYTGEFQHTLDAKNRVTIPAKWRSGKEVEGDEKIKFMLLPMPAGFIKVYPEEMIFQLNEAVKKVSLGDKKGQMAIRKISTSADVVPCDSSGRIMLSEKLMAHAGIQKESILAGTFTTFEIWNAETYQKQIRDGLNDTEDDELSAAFRLLGL